MEKINYQLTKEERKFLKLLKKKLKEDLYLILDPDKSLLIVVGENFFLTYKTENSSIDSLSQRYFFDLNSLLKVIKKAKVNEKINIEKYAINDKAYTVPSDKEIVSHSVDKDFFESICILCEYTKKIELFKEFNKVHWNHNCFLSSNLSSVAKYEPPFNLGDQCFMLDPTHLQMVKSYEFTKMTDTISWLTFSSEQICLFIKKETPTRTTFFDNLNISYKSEKVDVDELLERKDIQKIISEQVKKENLTNGKRQFVEAEIENSLIIVNNQVIGTFDDELKTSISASDILPFWGHGFSWYLSDLYLIEAIPEKKIWIFQNLKSKKKEEIINE